MASVSFQRVTKRFEGDVIAVDRLELDVRDGEFLVLVGPSGSGKSTALRMLAGLDHPTEGRIRIGDRDVTDVAPRERDVAMVFQNFALYPHMTVRENLSFGLRMRKVPRAEIERRVAATAAQLGLQRLLSRKPGALSGGERQRVALGRAIVREPSVFLFDEPLSNLDARLRAETRTELVRLHRELRTTMVYVTHDQVEAMTMGQRIAVLEDGRLQQVAAPLELYDRPANRFVAGFIGSPPMNFFPGRIEAGTARRFNGRSFTLDLAAPPADDAPARDVVLGIRPEHVRPAGDDADLRIRVLVVEPLGPETLIYGRTDQDEDVGVRIAGAAAIRPETSLALRLDRDRILGFDPESGTALPLTAEARP
ncbi:MAG: sn-glycerol-3-phosphate ABC transporter ATP-binding protein UgpC [Gemmatimonadota bacterium]|jgi:multiple sugar transport system ATP-binding protein